MERTISPQNPEGLTNTQKMLAFMLHGIGAIKFGEFKFKLHDEHPEAPLSPDYIDLRMLRRDVQTKRLAADTYVELIRQLDFNLLADVPTAATPIVSSLSDKLGVGMITPRTDAKRHGTGAKIDGLLPEDKGKKVVLVDDLITMAKSKMEAVDILRNAGMIVEDVVVLIDREQGGKEQLEKEGLKLHSAFTRKQMLDYYLRVGVISQETYRKVQEGTILLNSFLSSL